MEAVERKKIEKEPQSVSAIFQVFLIFCSAAMFSLIYMNRLEEFEPVDVIDHPMVFDSKKLTELGNFHTRIPVGLSISDFEVFDMTKNNFVLVGTVWFLVDPGVVSMQILDKFSFERGELLYVSAPDSRIVGDKLRVEYEIRLKFSTPLLYTYFPLDEHRLVIALTNKMLPPQKAIFVTENRYFIFSANMESIGWRSLDTFVEYGYKTFVLDRYDKTQKHDYSVVNFIIDFKRTSYRYIISIVLPLLLIFYLSLFAFSMEGPMRISIPAAGLTGIVTFRFVLDTLSPSVGYFILSDYLFFLFLFATFLAFIFILLDTFSFPLPLVYKKIIIAGLHTLVVGVNMYLVW